MVKLSELRQQFERLWAVSPATPSGGERSTDIHKTYRFVSFADAIFSLSDVMVTPYRSAKELSEIQFNHAHSSGRIAVEQEFGDLKSHVRILRERERC